MSLCPVLRLMYLENSLFMAANPSVREPVVDVVFPFNTKTKVGQGVFTPKAKPKIKNQTSNIQIN